MHRARLILTGVLAPPLFLGAALCAGAAAAAHLGRISLEWDILAHFAPVWFVGALAGLVMAFLFRGYARALILGMGVAGLVAAGALMAPEFLRDAGPEAPADAPDQLKVIQLNVWARTEDAEDIVDWLVAQDADILILEETFPKIRQMVAERTGYHVTCRNCETVIYSKRAPLRRKPERVRGEADGPLARAEFRDARGVYTVIGVHYAWPTDAADQQAQERRLARVISETNPGRTIVAGDFNSTPWSFSRRRWDAEFGLIRRDRALFSWPAQQYKRLRWLGLFPFLPIDHVYAGADWATVKVERGPRLASDHYPIVMVLAPASRL